MEIRLRGMRMVERGVGEPSLRGKYHDREPLTFRKSKKISGRWQMGMVVGAKKGLYLFVYSK